jgi:hypothetical protein
VADLLQTSILIGLNERQMDVFLADVALISPTAAANALIIGSVGSFAGLAMSLLYPWRKQGKMDKA